MDPPEVVLVAVSEGVCEDTSLILGPPLKLRLVDLVLSVKQCFDKNFLTTS